MKVKILYLIYLLSLVNISSAQSVSAVDSMLISIDRLTTMSCTIKSSERLEGRTATVTQNITATFEPYKCNVEFIAPKNGTRVVYCEGKNENELHYEPNGFPYFDLNLDPLGSLARRNNHHTILEVGFQYLANIIKPEKQKNRQLFTTNMVRINGKLRYLIHAKYNDYETFSYKMKQNETVRDIAFRFNISEYLIVKINDNLSTYNDWTDEEIQLPNHYCNEIKIYVDPDNWLPTSLQIYDEKGVFERYDYSNMLINSTIPSSKFAIN